MRLACLKSEFVKNLKHLCKEMVEQDEVLIPELEKYIKQCKSIGSGLDYEI